MLLASPRPSGISVRPSLLLGETERVTQLLRVHAVLWTHRVSLHSIQHTGCGDPDANTLHIHLLRLQILEAESLAQPGEDVQRVLAMRRNVLNGGVGASEVLGGDLVDIWVVV